MEVLADYHLVLLYVILKIMISSGKISNVRVVPIVSIESIISITYLLLKFLVDR